MTAYFVGVVGVALFGLAACNRPSSSGSSGSSGGSAAAPTSEASGAATAAGTKASPTASHAPPEVHVPAPCRAAGVEGSVAALPLSNPMADAGTPVASGVGVPDDVWMLVGKDSRLTTRDSVSTRETAYVGPGRFRVCIGHKEAAWVQSGVFESVGGAGERPGGEEWVATPLGSARYDVARWKITVNEKSVLVKVQSGSGYFWPADGVTTKLSSDAGAAPSVNDEGWVRLDGATTALVTAPKSVLTAEGAAAALDQCTRTAALAKSLAMQLGAPEASVGEVGPKHVIARRRAHAACDVAHLRIASLEESAARNAMLGRVLAAENEWKALAEPTPSPPDR